MEPVLCKQQVTGSRPVRSIRTKNRRSSDRRFFRTCPQVVFTDRRPRSRRSADPVEWSWESMAGNEERRTRGGCGVRDWCFRSRPVHHGHGPQAPMSRPRSAALTMPSPLMSEPSKIEPSVFHAAIRSPRSEASTSPFWSRSPGHGSGGGSQAPRRKVVDTHRPDFSPPLRDFHEFEGTLADGASTETGLPCQLRGSASSMAMPSGRTT